MMYKIREEELKILHQQSYEIKESNIRLYFNALETFVNAQASLSYDQQIKIKKLLENIDTPTFKDAFNSMTSSEPNGFVYVPIMDKQETYTVQEVVKLCGISAQMVRRACEEGKIKAYRGKKRSWIIPKEPFQQSEIYKNWIRDKSSGWDIIDSTAGTFSENLDFIKGLEKSEKDRKSED